MCCGRIVNNCVEGCVDFFCDGYGVSEALKEIRFVLLHSEINTE